MRRLIRYVEDCVLRFIQKRCEHPSEMVAADILEGCADGIEIKYCRRCGSVKTEWDPHDPAHKYMILEHWWRRPDPFLWRGL